MPRPHATGKLTPKRQALVDRYGSPVFTFAPGVIAAGASERINLNGRFPRSQKYAPLDHVDIINNSSRQLLIIINGNRPDARTVPGGTIAQLSNIGIVTFEVENEDAIGATAANEINCQFSKLPLTQDEKVRRSVGR